MESWKDSSIMVLIQFRTLRHQSKWSTVTGRCRVVMNWAETIQSMERHLSGRSTQDRVGKDRCRFIIGPRWRPVNSGNGFLIAPNEFGTPQMSILHMRSCCSSEVKRLDTPHRIEVSEYADMRIGKAGQTDIDWFGGSDKFSKGRSVVVRS